MTYSSILNFGVLTLLTTAGLSGGSPSSGVANHGDCLQTIATAAGAVAKDLAGIAAQANAQGFKTAVEQFASDLQSVFPTLNPPSQQAVQKFVTDLESATSPTSPYGTAISPGEQLILTNDWLILVTSTGLTSAEITTLTDDLTTAFASLQGISTSQLQGDLNVLLTDTRACIAEL